MGKIERYDVSEEWAHSGIIKAGDLRSSKKKQKEI